MPYFNAHNYVTTYLFDNVALDLDSVLPVTCSDVVTLSARVSGDLTGHTFEWSQLSGTPVTWLESVNQTDVMFQQPSIRDDKIFRFTIDKGTAVAKYKDILVTAVPTDYLRSSVGIDASYEINIELSSTILVPMFRSAGSQVINDTNRALILPTIDNTLPTRISSIALQELQNGKYVDNDIHYYPSYGTINDYFNNFQTDKSYRLKSISNGVTSYSASKSLSSRNFNYVSELSIHDDELLDTTISIDNNYGYIVEVISRSLISDNITDTTDTLFTTVYVDSNYSSTIEVISRSLISDNITDNVDTLVTLVKNDISYSDVVEVKSYQFSSLG